LIVGHHPVSREMPVGTRSLRSTGSIVSSRLAAASARFFAGLFFGALFFGALFFAALFFWGFDAATSAVLPDRRRGQPTPRSGESGAGFALKVPCVAKERLKSPRARLFVALDLPEPVREEMVAWQRRELTDPALRPVRPESLHMTLVFLGHQAEGEIERIAEAAFDVDVPAPQVAIERDPVGVPRGRPRLLALDTPSPGAVALQAAVERNLVAGRFYEPEKRPFWPHLTVARVRPARRGSRKPAAVERWPGPLPAQKTRPEAYVRLVLFRSHLRPQGAEYIPLAETNLKPATTER
jgi:2'-5' RNA ligase